MKQLLAGLVIGLGVLHGAQADVQQQNFKLSIPADSDTYSTSFAIDPFNASLGTLTGIQWGYSLFSSFDYTITNNSTRTINPITVSAQEGIASVTFLMNGVPVYNDSTAISGSNTFSLAPGAHATDTLWATAKGEFGVPGTPLPTGMTVDATFILPSFSVSARNFNNLLVSASGGAVTGNAYFNYVYDAAAPVPEPESYAMILAGLGLIGAMVARRKAL